MCQSTIVRVGRYLDFGGVEFEMCQRHAPAGGGGPKPKGVHPPESCDMNTQILYFLQSDAPDGKYPTRRWSCDRHVQSLENGNVLGIGV